MANTEKPSFQKYLKYDAKWNFGDKYFECIYPSEVHAMFDM